MRAYLLELQRRATIKTNRRYFITRQQSIDSGGPQAMEQGESTLNVFARIQAVAVVLALGALAGLHAPAYADVTTQESTALDAIGIVKLHGTSSSAPPRQAAQGK